MKAEWKKIGEDIPSTGVWGMNIPTGMVFQSEGFPPIFISDVWIDDDGALVPIPEGHPDLTDEIHAMRGVATMREALESIVACDENDENAPMNRVVDWTLLFGETVCPGKRPDTFGEGMRAAKAEVASILFSHYEHEQGEEALRAAQQVAEARPADREDDQGEVRCGTCPFVWTVAPGVPERLLPHGCDQGRGSDTACDEHPALRDARVDPLARVETFPAHPDVDTVSTGEIEITQLCWRIAALEKRADAAATVERDMHRRYLDAGELHLADQSTIHQLEHKISERIEALEKRADAAAVVEHYMHQQGTDDAAAPLLDQSTLYQFEHRIVERIEAFEDAASSDDGLRALAEVVRDMCAETVQYNAKDQAGENLYASLRDTAAKIARGEEEK